MLNSIASNNMCNSAHMSSALSHDDRMCINAYSAQMIKNSDEIAWKAIQALAKKNGKTPSAMAKDSKVAHTTLTRQKGNMRMSNLQKLFKHYGYQSYEHFIIEWMGSGNMKNDKKEALLEPPEAIIDVLGMVLYILASYQVIPIERIDASLNYLSGHYLKWHSQADMKLIGQVRDALDGKKDSPLSHTLQKILLHPHHGSA